MTDDGHCRTCRFWDEDKRPRHPLAESTGLCRRYAPRFLFVDPSDSQNFTVLWPTTAATDSCGEHLARPS